MLSKTSRKDVAKDKASDLASAVADAAEAGREKIAPVARNVTGHLSDAADKASEAAAPHVAKAKQTVAEAAAPQVTKAKKAAKQATEDATDAAAPHVAKAKKAAKQATEDATDAAAPHVAKAKKAAKQATEDATDAAAPHVAKAKKAAKQATEDATDAAAPHVKKAKKAAKQASKNAAKVKATTAERAEAAGLTREQAHRLFADEWMPRIQQTIAATTAAGSQAYAALPQQARDAVETVAPQVAKKRRKKGKVLIALGLIAGAGAVALYLSGQQKGGAKRVPEVTAPEIERLDVNPIENTAATPTSDDAVGDLEKKADASVSGSRRGRHAAQE